MISIFLANCNFCFFGDLTFAARHQKCLRRHPTKLFNKLRQEAITSELLDIIGGAEAIN